MPDEQQIIYSGIALKDAFEKHALDALKEAWRQKYRDKVAELVTQYNTGGQA